MLSSTIQEWVEAEITSGIKHHPASCKTQMQLDKCVCVCAACGTYRSGVTSDRRQKYSSFTIVHDCLCMSVDRSNQ